MHVKVDCVVAESQAVYWLSKRTSIQAGRPHELVHPAPVHSIAGKRQCDEALAVSVHLPRTTPIKREDANEHASIEWVHVGGKHIPARTGFGM